jgi:hypothetical protein
MLSPSYRRHATLIINPMSPAIASLEGVNGSVEDSIHGNVAGRLNSIMLLYIQCTQVQYNIDSTLDNFENDNSAKKN